MADDAVVDALALELQRAMAAVRSAQRLLAQLDREPKGRGGRRQPAPTRQTRDLRYVGMTVAEAASALGVGEEHLRRLLRRGELSGVAYGGRTGWRLPRDYVLDLQRQIATAKEGRDAARQRLIPGSRPVGRPPKSRHEETRAKR